MKVILEMYLAN